MTETPSCSIKSSSSDDDDDDQTNTMQTLLKALTQSLGSFSCFSLFLALFRFHFIFYNSNKNNNKTISVVAPNNQSLLAFFDYFRNWKAQFHLLRLWLSHRVPFWRSTTNDPRGQDNRNEPQYEADASERNAGVDDIAVASRSFMMNDSSFPIIAPTFYE